MVIPLGWVHTRWLYARPRALLLSAPTQSQRSHQSGYVEQLAENRICDVRDTRSLQSLKNTSVTSVFREARSENSEPGTR